MTHTDQLDAIARDWANGKMALYEALYAAYGLGFRVANEEAQCSGMCRSVAELTDYGPDGCI
jgi:hypothetical protein